MSRPFLQKTDTTALVVAYRNGSTFIADRVLPDVDVDAEKFKWQEYSLDQFLTPHGDTEVSRKGLTSEIELLGTEKEDKTKDYALEFALPYSDIDEADSKADPRDMHVTQLSEVLLLDREIRARDVIFGESNYVHKELAQLKFDNPDADLLSYFLDSLETPIIRPNQITIGQTEWSKLRRNKSLIQAIKGQVLEHGAITPQQLADILEIDRVIVGRSQYNVSRKGKTSQIAKIWNGSAAFNYINPAATNNSGLVTYGYTAVRDRDYREWDDPDVGADGGIRGRVIHRCKELVVAPELGLLMTGVLTAK
ncbi:hypothetical protein NOL32_26340 [Vibrio parahaemolyticus]|uniref:hypothetical protein n=1 Tax=Vibrio parahaemolyticus TaxID=670 RepID=UPI00226A8C82|nr:hypothetical protein [Vibrio parahaemolyticus]MCX8926231.1 hypothetical protein [Vibrio parahaemolyticus]